ncbi:hypothetical protein ACFX1Z_037832 [Malus domestica]
MASHTPNLECQMYGTRYSDVDMAVMIQVKNIIDIGAYVSLLEYNNIEGMILFFELSRRRIRSVSNLIEVGRIEPVMVLRVDKDGEDGEVTVMVESMFNHSCTKPATSTSGKQEEDKFLFSFLCVVCHMPKGIR